MEQHKRLTRGPLRKIFIHNIRQLMIFWIPCVLLVLILAGMQIHRSLQYVQNQGADWAGRVASRLNEELLSIESSANLLSYNYDIKAFIQKDSLELSEKMIRQLNSIQYQLSVIHLQHPCVSGASIHLLPQDYFIFETASYARKESSYARNVEETAFARIQAEELRRGWMIEPNYCCYYAQIERNNTISGTILILLTDTSVGSALGTDLRYGGGRMLIVSEEGRIMMDSQSAAAGKYIQDVYQEYRKNGNGSLLSFFSQQHVFVQADSVLPGYEYLLVIPSDFPGGNWYQSVLLMLALSVGLLAISVFFLYRAAESLYYPYETILELLQKPEILTNEEYEQRYRTIDKLGMIYTLIHQKSYQYMAIKGELSEKDRMIREAQNAMLQAQMNPHFLFNALDNIYWMAMEDLPENNRISATIYRLSNLLRLSLQRRSPVTTIREEIEHAQLYLEIQKIRKDEPFTVEWKIDHNLNECAMPCLSLQPLLENAIHHSLKGRKNSRIEIDIHENNGQVFASVTDNGSGFSPEQMENIHARLNLPYATLEHHIGLANINARLQLIYGENGVLSIESVPDDYTTIRMCFPKMNAAKAYGAYDEPGK